MTNMVLRGAASLFTVAMLGCAGAAPPPAGAPAPDPDALARAIAEATTPSAPQRVSFAWELDEAGSRLRGRGVVRMEAPRRLRLDLFGPRGETYLSAALVGEELRVPAAVASRFALPSPALLWGALGVMRPPSGAVLTRAGISGDTAVLHYERGPERFEVTAVGERLAGIRRSGSGPLESITLVHGERAPRASEYRDHGAYRSLVLTFESFTDVDAFAESTWAPPGADR